MIVYHVFGKVNKEKYYFISGCDSLISYRPRNWDSYPYEINSDTTSDDIFKDIKNAKKRYETYDIWDNYNNTATIIPEIYLYINKSNRQILLRKCCFTGVYKEFTTIKTDIELRNGETIHINGEDYEVKYKYNADVERHELYINKVVETVIDKNAFNHAKKVCNEVIKKILRHNRDLAKKNKIENKNKEIEETRVEVEKGIENIEISEDNNIFKRILYKILLTIKRLKLIK